MQNKKIDTGHVVVMIVLGALLLACLAVPVLACFLGALV